MACRQNLKKEKRMRNRINAFRFKKGMQVFAPRGRVVAAAARLLKEPALCVFSV